MKKAIAIRMADQLFLVDVEELATWHRLEADEPGHKELVELMPHGTVGSGVVAAIGNVPVDEDCNVLVDELEPVEPVPPSGGKQRFVGEV